MLASILKLAERSWGNGLQLAAELLSSPNAFHAFPGTAPRRRQLLSRSCPGGGSRCITSCGCFYPEPGADRLEQALWLIAGQRGTIKKDRRRWCLSGKLTWNSLKAPKEIININDEQNIKKKINFQLYIYIQNYHNFHLWHSAHN